LRPDLTKDSPREILQFNHSVEFHVTSPSFSHATECSSQFRSILPVFRTTSLAA